MKNQVTKFGLFFLLLALVVVVYLDSTSVKRVDLDHGYGAAATIVPQQVERLSPQPPPATIVKSRLVAGETFTSMDELLADQRAAGYLKTGYFGKYWPATVAEIKSSNHGIVFHKQDGIKHSYTGFEGYRLKMVRLLAGDKRETIVVFRSAEKF